MNNLKYFRELSGVQAEYLSKLLGIQKRRYLMIERETLLLESWCIFMLCKIYKIDKSLIYKSNLQEDDIKEIKKLSTLSLEEKKRTLIFNLCGQRKNNISCAEIQEIKQTYRKNKKEE